MINDTPESLAACYDDEHGEPCVPLATAMKMERERNDLAKKFTRLDKPKYSGDPMLDAVLADTNPDFRAWVDSLPPTYWARYDLSAARIGWEAAFKFHSENASAMAAPTTQHPKTMPTKKQPSKPRTSANKKAGRGARARCSGFYIVNRYDRPSEEHIAERRANGYLYYVHPSLRDEKRYWAMKPDDPTPLEVFGIRVLIEGGVLHGTLVDPSRATYLDGRQRKWQGSAEFSFDYPNVQAQATPSNQDRTNEKHRYTDPNKK